MATAHISKLFRGIGKPSGRLALLMMLAIGILGLFGLIVAGGFSLHSQLDKLKIELVSAKRDLEITNERLVSLQREVGQIRQEQPSVAATRPEDRLSATQPTSPLNNVLRINAVEAKFIREFLLKLDAFKPMVKAGYKVGDTIPEDRLLDFSAVLTEMVPKLNSTRYTIDQNGSIIIVSENRIIVAILDFVSVAR
jgi:hypothetical protein